MPGDFTIYSEGGCRLNPEMARVDARQIGVIEPNVISTFMNQMRSMVGVEGSR
jgi:hypothetical protein